MLNQTYRYRIGVVLLALVLLVPQVILCYPLVYFSLTGMSFLPSIPGFTKQSISYSEFSYGSLWQNQLVRVTHDIVKWNAKRTKGGIFSLTTETDFDLRVELVDPETGVITKTEWEMKGNGYFPRIVGNRLLFKGHHVQSVNLPDFEMIDGKLQPADLDINYDPLVLLNGEIARIQQKPGTATFVVSTRKDGTWGNDQVILLPTTNSPTVATLPSVSDLDCINQKDRIHAFLRLNGRLWYRLGLPLRRIDDDDDNVETINVGFGNEMPPAVDGDLAGWILVSYENPDTQHSGRYKYGTLVEGRPGALIVENVETGYPLGHLCKFDGVHWSEYATLPFPFGSNEFRALARQDDQSPYIVATTSTGTGFVFVVEPTGIREVKGQGPTLTWVHLKRNLIAQLSMLGIPYLSGLLPGFGIWLLMALLTRPQYGFGQRTVRLASLGRRGFARLIDLALIACSTTIVGWILLRDFDWLSLAEAINLHLDHPAVNTAKRVLIVLVIWTAMAIVIGVAIQGRWGITPGKWFCGLRTMRTTLRPCGFARSLVRELLLAIDSCYLFCWLPGMLSIAVITNRQRLGDFIGDTIVVEARSLISVGAPTGRISKLSESWKRCFEGIFSVFRPKGPVVPIASQRPWDVGPIRIRPVGPTIKFAFVNANHVRTDGPSGLATMTCICTRAVGLAGGTVGFVEPETLHHRPSSAILPSGKL